MKKFGALLMAVLLVVGATPSAFAAEPVSYTHLDVYKRQAYGCGSAGRYGEDAGIVPGKE